MVDLLDRVGGRDRELVCGASGSGEPEGADKEDSVTVEAVDEDQDEDDEDVERHAEEVHHRRATFLGHILAAEHTDKSEVHSATHLKDHEGHEHQVTIL